MIVVVALLLRMVYVPHHLMDAAHYGADGHALSHALTELGDHRTGHGDHRHDHDDDHAPHPAADHERELVAQRAPVRHTSVDVQAMLLAEERPLSTPGASSMADAPDPGPPRSGGRSVQRSRAPPAAA